MYLVWEFTTGSEISSVSFYRQIPGSPLTSLALRSGSSSFNVGVDYRARYEARLPATLVLKDVKRNEEYQYTITVVDTKPSQVIDRVTINVVGKKAF